MPLAQCVPSFTFQSGVELRANNSSWLDGQADHNEICMLTNNVNFKSCRVDFFLISTFLSGRGRIINNCKMNLEFRILEKNH